jgi:ubiquinone/menaquinone biosynthesis C-methylase UbiE
MAQINKYKQSFGLVSKEYKKYRGTYTNGLYTLLFSLVKRRKRDTLTVLDLGCGVGNSTEPFLQMARKMKIPVSLVGCDPDERMLKEARISAKKNKLPIVYVLGKAEKLPFQKEQFDLVISGAAFHWFATKKAMGEVQRVLRKGGAYVAFWTQNIPDKNIIIGQALYKKYKWQGIPKGLRDPKNVRNVFIKAGFSKVKTMKTPYSERRTMDETIGLMKTNSSYALLSPKDKKIFEREMRKEYVKVLGRDSDTVEQVINVCSGIK